jgi:ABC-type phosphate/phosphonate transport system substrate-binding protein
MTQTLLLGAVAYDPKVVTIWDGFLRWFEARGLAFDYVLYTSYERLVEAQLAGHVDVAWNSPLAWLEADWAAARRGLRATAIAMRDSDQDLRSLVLVKSGGPVRELGDLRGKRVGLGAKDSPQATLIPLEHLAQAGISQKDLTPVYHDVLVGKHGDHVGGERDAARALVEGRVDAACVLDANLDLFVREGTLPPGFATPITSTGTYDHCNFTVLSSARHAGLVDRFRELLLSMRYEDPEVRPLLDLEGLKAWRPGRTEGYALLSAAVRRTGYLEPWLASAVKAT